MTDNIKNEIEEEIPADTDDAAVDIDTEDADTEDDISEDFEDFEYDENGDIKIPEDSEDSDTEDGEEEDGAEEETQDENAEEDAADAPPAEVVEPAQQPDNRESVAARRLSALERQTRETLKKLGVDIGDGDPMAGLEKLAAEADDIPIEEYRRRKADEDRKNEAIRHLQATEFEKKMKADLAEIHAAYPETKSYNSVTEIPNFAKFGQFRDKGLTPKEAYIAANPDAVRASVATATKRQSLNDTKNHLRPVVSKASKDTSTTITKRELAEYRDLFPDKTDKEIIALYRQTQKK